MTSKQRAGLRGQANTMDPIFQIGKGGINENFIEQVDECLEKRELIKITLLQMVKRVVPLMSNEIITLVKDTSLARVIGVIELTHAGYAYIKAAGIIWPLFYTAVFYLLFVGILTLLFNYIERRLNYFR